jgi:uncharacterized protein (TIGR02246 family)
VNESDGVAVQQLVDVEEIKRLKARYFRALDTKAWKEFGSVFTVDAVLEVPEAAMVTEGRDAIVAAVSSALVGTTTVHHGHMPEIELNGPDTARGTWAMADYVEWPASESGARVGLRGFGHYHEEYVRRDGRWYIHRSRLERLRIDPLGADLPSVGEAR